MPKVSDAHRESRREQITAAALACFAEKGFQKTSMADIIQASGLSAGAIYLHFASKQEIALAAGRQVLARRLGELEHLDQEHLADPIETLRGLLAAMVEDMVDSRILVQLWGEATTDPGMSGLVGEILATLGGAWTHYLETWAAQHDAVDPAAWARTALPALLGIAQGFLVQRAIVPGFDADAYFASVRLIAGPGLLSPG